MPSSSRHPNPTQDTACKSQFPSAGAIAGGIVGCLVAVVLILVIAWWAGPSRRSLSTWAQKQACAARRHDLVGDDWTVLQYWDSTSW
jgi:hypothetical protein